MRRNILKMGWLVCLALYIPQASWGEGGHEHDHDHGHAHHHSGDAHAAGESSWDRVDRLLQATFVELDRLPSADANPTQILLVDSKGNYYAIPKSKLAEALSSSLEMSLEEHCHSSSCSHHCHHPRPGRAVWKDRILGFLLSPVTGAKQMAVQLPPTLSELAGEFGVLPAATVIALWAPYTVVTEILESAVMGHWHWACQFFQAAYWGPVGFVFMNLSTVKEAVLARESEHGVMRRLYLAFKDRVREWKFRRIVRSSFATESQERQFSRARVDAFHSDFHHIDSLTKLFALIDSELDAALASKKIDYWQSVRARYYAGRVKALLHSYRHARWFVAHEPHPEIYQPWLQHAESALLKVLRSFWEYVSGRKNLEAFQASVEAEAETILLFRGGCSEFLASQAVLGSSVVGEAAQE